MSSPSQPTVPPLPAAARSMQELFNPAVPPPLLIMYLTGGTMLISRALYLAAELRVADLLAQGPRHVEDLARATGTDADSLFRLLRALEAMGILAQEGERTFRNTPLAHGLRSGVPGSMQAWARYFGGPWHWQSLGHALGSLKNGRSIPENEYGTGMFDFFSQNPEQGKLFDEAMTSISNGSNALLLAAYDFAGVRSVADVGGGQGRLLAEILRAHPGLQGTLFDRPEVIERAREPGILAEFERAGRCQLVGGSFFEAVPPGQDLYLFKEILHNWRDPDVKRILEVTREAAGGPGKKVLIMEMIIDPAPEKAIAGKLVDLLMLTMLGGRERTPKECGELFAATGFELERVIPTLPPYALVEGVSV